MSSCMPENVCLKENYHFALQTTTSVCENTEVTWNLKYFNACGMSCSSSVTKAGLCICQAFCNLQPFWGVVSFRLYTRYVNTLHHSRPGFKHMRLDWVFWVLSTRGPKRVPLSVQLDTTAAEGPRLEIVCHSSFSLSPHCLLLWFVLWRDKTDSWRVWLMNHEIGFLWVQDSSLFL